MNQYFFMETKLLNRYNAAHNRVAYTSVVPCGCEAQMMDDLAYSIRCIWRSLSDLQSIAVAGKYGKHADIVRPFSVTKY